MKKIAALMVICLLGLPFTMEISAKEISTSAGATVLYCVESDTVLYQKNMNKQMKMASTTKIMTTLITLEEAEKKNKTVTFTKDMIEEGSSMYLKLGEKVTLKDLCVGMMLPSGNDAATAAAMSISGSKEDFAVKMNDKAKKLGLKDSHFVTPSGLDDEEHYSTAHDMAMLMKECIRHKDFVEISGSKSKSVSFVSPRDKIVTYQNHNRLLSEYPYCIAGKTGYTMAAGRCLVTAAKKDGVTLIAVTLNDRDDWNDHKNLFDYGFSKIHKSTLKGKTIKTQIVGGTKDVTSIKIPTKNFYTEEENPKITSKIFLSSFEYAPVKKGSKAGCVVFYDGKTELECVDLTYTEDIEYKHENFIIEFFRGLF
ncbi:MAG: D-alanyl-D-alanine carboxypeptidase [Ruminococcus sp.]|nr:D-alanyl-D-alanine carboxypeptidase [Ruminococcus sp.]